MTLSRLRRPALCALLALCALASHAAPAAVADSTLRAAGRPVLRTWPYALGAGAILFAEGATGRAASDAGTIVARDARSSVVADVAQFMPLAALWACNIAGERQYSWAQSATSQAFGLLLDEALLWTLKHSVDARRPDGSGNRSFPSGHTARAFFGATCFAIEQGEANPQAAVATYIFASAVGAQRVLTERHFPVDVIAGAGLGIMTAQAGYLLSDLIFRRSHDAVRPTDAASRFDVVTGLEARLATVALGSSSLHFLPALQTGLSAAHRFDSRWGVGASAMLTSSPMRLDDSYAGCRNSLSLMAGPTLLLAATKRADLSASLRGGYRFDFRYNYLPTLTTGRGGAVGAIDLRGAVRVRSHMTVALNLGWAIGSEAFSLDGYRRRVVSNALSLALSSGLVF